MFLLTCGHRGVILVERNILICKNWKRNLKDKMSCLWAFPVIMSCGDGKGPWKTGKCWESSGGLEMILLHNGFSSRPDSSFYPVGSERAGVAFRDDTSF